jgi:hypothetical protein
MLVAFSFITRSSISLLIPVKRRQDSWSITTGEPFDWGLVVLSVTPVLRNSFAKCEIPT